MVSAYPVHNTSTLFSVFGFDSKSLRRLFSQAAVMRDAQIRSYPYSSTDANHSFPTCQWRIDPSNFDTDTSELGVDISITSEVGSNIANFGATLGDASWNFAYSALPPDLPVDSLGPLYGLSGVNVAFYSLGVLSSSTQLVSQISDTKDFVQNYSPTDSQSEIEHKIYNGERNQMLTAVGCTAVQVASDVSLLTTEAVQLGQGFASLATTAVSTTARLAPIVGSGIGLLFGLGSFVSSVFSYFSINRKIERMEANKKEHPVSESSTDPLSVKHTDMILKLQEIRLRGKREYGKKHLKQDLISNGFSLGSAIASVVGSTLLAFGVVSCGIATGGLALIGLCGAVPFLYFSIKRFRAKLKGKRAERELHKKILSGIGQVSKARSKVLELVSKRKQLESSRKVNGAFLPHLEKELSSCDQLIQQSAEEGKVNMEKLEGLSDEWLESHPWQLAKEILTKVFDPQTPQEYRETMKNNIRNYSVRKKEQFNQIWDLLEKKWKTGNPKDQRKAEYHLLRWMTLPMEQYVPFNS